jgi:hypothetical protein
LRAIMQALTPWIDLAEVDRLPIPIAMRVGDSWTGNLVLPGPPPPRLQRKAENPLQEMWLLEQAQRRQQRLWPGGKPLPAALTTAPTMAPTTAR